MRGMSSVVFLAWALLLLGGCSDSTSIEQCEPASACMCTQGTERETRCTCSGGSTCTVSGGGIELDCQGNADCALNCGEDCLTVCPGTTSCSVITGDQSEVRCQGTASCDVTCESNCSVEVTGAADAVVECAEESAGAVCALTGCDFEDCGGSVYACRTACPSPS